MQQLHHAAVDRENALALALGQRERGDDLARECQLGVRRGENLVGDSDLVGVDQRLAVEAAIAALPAFGAKALCIGQTVVDPVENVDPMRPRGRKGRPRFQRLMIFRLARSTTIGCPAVRGPSCSGSIATT